MLQNSNLYAIMECWKILFTFYQILLYKVRKTKLGGHNSNKSGLEAYYKVLKSFQHASSKWCLRNRQVLVDLMKLSEIFYLGYGLFTICISLGQNIHYISLWNWKGSKIYKLGVPFNIKICKLLICNHFLSFSISDFFWVQSLSAHPHIYLYHV